MNTNSIVMWEIPLNNADWDCFKILTSREVLKIQNPLQEEHYVFSEVFSGKLDVQEYVDTNTFARSIIMFS